MRESYNKYSHDYSVYTGEEVFDALAGVDNADVDATIKLFERIGRKFGIKPEEVYILRTDSSYDVSEYSEIRALATRNAIKGASDVVMYTLPNGVVTFKEITKGGEIWFYFESESDLVDYVNAIDGLYESVNKYDDAYDGEGTVDCEYPRKRKKAYDRDGDYEADDEYEGYDVDVEEVSKSTNESISKPLNEGPGAGYTIEGYIDILNIRKESIKEIKLFNDEYGHTIRLTFDKVFADAKNLEFNSYYYGGAIKKTEAIVTLLEFPVYIEDVIDDTEFINSEPDDEALDAYAKEHFDKINIPIPTEFTFKTTLGGGWSHTEFDGTLCNDSTTYDNDIYRCEAFVEDDYTINFIDNAVSGNDFHYDYEVVTELDEEGEFFDDKDEAIKRAKEINAISVVERTYKDVYDENGENTEVEYVDDTTIWRNNQ